MRSNDNTRPTQSLRHGLRRPTRQLNRALARELATYNSAADLLDLETLLDSLPAEQTAEVRSILARQAA